MSLGIILTPDSRSKAYLQKIIKNNFKLDSIIFMNDNRNEKNYSSVEVEKSKESGFDISIPVHQTLRNERLPFKEFNFVDINHQNLVKFLNQSKIDKFIFTGGGILKKEILNSGPKFIHFHPGIVPNYRGSTCFYYSIIAENMCGVTCYFMDEKLDTGNIIYQKTFAKPTHPYIDDIYDSFIRSETLVEVLKNNLICSGDYKIQNPNEGTSYFIIHPVLKHIAIMDCIIDQN